jgi:ZIP family zinc transporter
MTELIQAGLLGLLAGSALLIGAIAGLCLNVSQRGISLWMAFGAGALMSAVAFDLMDQAYRHGGFDDAAVGLLCGSLAFFTGDVLLMKMGGMHRKRSQKTQSIQIGLALALGALLDGVPESVAIGAASTQGRLVGWAMVGAVFLSNIPESLASAVTLKRSGFGAGRILQLWTTLMLVCALSAVIGHASLAHATGDALAATQAFAAGAILTMLASTMMPEAYESGGPVVGLATALGFLSAFILDKL